jgi:hypothetical protein
MSLETFEGSEFVPKNILLYCSFAKIIGRTVEWPRCVLLVLDPASPPLYTVDHGGQLASLTFLPSGQIVDGAVDLGRIRPNPPIFCKNRKNSQITLTL